MGKKNRLQYQKGLSLVDFVARYGTEEQCADALERQRWPRGFVCPQCQGSAARRFQRGGQRLYACLGCRRQTSLIAGTILTATKLPLTKWFMAIYLLTQTKTNLAALELMRHLHVCYRSAWRLKQKLMQLMSNAEACRQLADWIEIDDAYLGGERNGGTAGRGSENKVPIVAAVSTTPDGRPIAAVISPVTGFTKVAIAAWAERHLSPGCEVYTDGLPCWRVFAELGHAHTVIEKGPGLRRDACRAQGARWVNVFLSNVKRAIDGRYHAFAFSKYAARYLAEAAWRFNRRFKMDEIADDLIGMLTLAEPWPERRLREEIALG